jgi:DNA-binding response OmpR family regulator
MSQHILLIEPEEEARQLLTTALTTHGFEVSCPVDSYAGLEFANQQTFEAIVLNDDMPILSGQHFLRILLKQGNEIPAIVLSDAPPHLRANTYPDYPALAWIGKPFRIQDLVSRIHTLTQTA